MIKTYLLFFILLTTLFLFILGRWRYDVVALFALVASVLSGIVPFDSAFMGFANPAVITVACVMILTFSITESGILDYVVHKITPITHHELLHIGLLTLITAILSAFMNNVGALALMMPVAIQTSIKAKRSPSLVLMPLAFGSVLGGLTTAIGTPPNLLISNFREQVTGHAFAMFDFTPVGLVVAAAGIIFIVFLGFRLLPERKRAKNTEDMFQINEYITELKVTEDSKVIDCSMKELEKLVDADFVVVGLIRKRKKRLVISEDEILQKNDILIIEANHQDLDTLMSKTKLKLVSDDKIGTGTSLLKSDDIALIEAVVPPGSKVEGRSSQSIRLRSRYRVNLIALARQGSAIRKRLSHVNFLPGDVVMLQGDAGSLKEDVIGLGFLPIVERGVQVGLPKKAFMPVFLFAVSIILAALQILPVQISFITAVLFLLIFNIMPARRVYETIDWSIIVLLGALIPVGQALESTGATVILGHYIQDLSHFLSPSIMLALLFFITMTLSDLMNNAATAVVMAPIGITMAQTLHAHVDPFLMTVAVSASCSFLTPISHQNNTLVMGPGGYKFLDYLRMGIPLELIVIIIAVPMILWIWPLY